jgi:hypothetical protein
MTTLKFPRKDQWVNKSSHRRVLITQLMDTTTIDSIKHASDQDMCDDQRQSVRVSWNNFTKIVWIASTCIALAKFDSQMEALIHWQHRVNFVPFKREKDPTSAQVLLRWVT